jgi:NAD(P)-dependent dehydrogenase (short-subunit alcohol dehydrogenase family)
VRRTSETNLFGVAAPTQALLPLFKRLPSARIVNVPSSLGSFAAVSDPSSAYYNFGIFA